jgi:16S rRNA (cytosine1402-N4)-methyltransferase
MHHTPVLLGKVMEILEECACYGNVVDATLGLGGYAERILSSRKEVRLLGIDRDEEALQFAKERLASFGERFVAVQGNFRNLETLVCDQGFSPAKAILFDLGVSNFQLSEPRRGFSFQNEGPLDMRMGSDASLTAEAVLNTASCGELTRIFRDYGEERHAYSWQSSSVPKGSEAGDCTPRRMLWRCFEEVCPRQCSEKWVGILLGSFFKRFGSMSTTS